MKKFNITTQVVATLYLGEFEAESEGEAVEKAFNSLRTDTLSLCWHCSNEHNISELYVSSNDEDIDVEEVNLKKEN